MQDSTYELAKRKVDDLQKSIDDLRVKLDELQARRNDEHNQLQAWKVIMQAEQPTVSLEITETEENGTDEPDPYVTLQQNVHPQTGILHMDMDAYGSKTAAVRRFLLSQGVFGVTPAEVSGYLEGQNIKASSGFASNALFKMKERGEVVIVGSRYYLPQSAPAAQPEEGIRGFGFKLSEAVKGGTLGHLALPVSTFGEFVKNMQKEKEDSEETP